VSAVENDNVIALLAALVEGDRWLSADACAAFLGGIARRTFLEKYACLPTFPTPLPLGKVCAWKKSEVDAWAEKYRSSQGARPSRKRPPSSKSAAS
jgi:predicted DNA-binding transcriptional regulator AlpA